MQPGTVPCSDKRGVLNQRMPWKGHWARPRSISSIAALRDYSLCPDLTGTAVLAEAAELLNRFVPRLSRHHRPLNLTNTSQWLVHRAEAKQWVRMGERHLLRLMSDGGLLRHFDPAHWSSAPFFRAVSFIRALLRASPLLGSELKRRHVSMNHRGWWRTLKSQVTSDGPMYLSLPDPIGPCTLPLVVSDLLQIDSLRFQAGPTWDDAAGLQIWKLLASAQANLDCTIRDRRLLDQFMFSGADTFFALLDRLDCRLWSVVTTPLGPSQFWMRLLPLPFTEANRVRGLRKFHCAGAFRDLLEELLPGAASLAFRFVEVGPSLGGCTFHVLTRVPAASAVAVEPHQVAAEALRMTATWNNLADRVAVRQAFVSDKAGACRASLLGSIYDTRNPEWAFEEAGPEASNCEAASLEEILTSAWGVSGTVDLLRVHVDGREEMVLKSLRDRLSPGSIQAIALAMWPFREADALYDPAAIAHLLRSRGYEIQLQFKTFASTSESLWNEDAIRALRTGVQTPETMTLIASQAQARKTSPQSSGQKLDLG